MKPPTARPAIIRQPIDHATRRKPRRLARAAVVKAKPMSPDQFRDALDQLDLQQNEFARFLAVADRTVRGWAGGEDKYPIPRSVEILIAIMLYRKLTPDAVTRTQQFWPFDKFGLHHGVALLLAILMDQRITPIEALKLRADMFDD